MVLPEYIIRTQREYKNRLKSEDFKSWTIIVTDDERNALENALCDLRGGRSLSDYRAHLAAQEGE